MNRHLNNNSLYFDIMNHYSNLDNYIELFQLNLLNMYHYLNMEIINKEEISIQKIKKSFFFSIFHTSHRLPAKADELQLQ